MNEIFTLFEVNIIVDVRGGGMMSVSTEQG